jgi:hypothetical protein
MAFVGKDNNLEQNDIWIRVWKSKEKIILLTIISGFAMLKTPHLMKIILTKLGMLIYGGGG